MVNTVNKGFEIQATGANVGTWGAELNINVISILDKNLGGSLTISLTNANYTLSTADAQNAIHILTGTLTSNIVLTYPAVGSFYIVENKTTGNYSITIANGAGTSIIPPRNTRALIATDATYGVRFGAQSGLPPGTIIDYAGPTVNTSLIGTEWLLCDGSTFSRTGQPTLFAAIGTTWGAGDGSTTANLPNLIGRGRAMIDTGGSVLSGGASVGLLIGQQNFTMGITNMPSHDHGATTGIDSPDHTHNTSALISNGIPAGDSGNARNILGTQTNIVSGGANQRHTHSIAAQGNGTPFQIVQPTAVVNCLIKT